MSDDTPGRPGRVLGLLVILWSVSWPGSGTVFAQERSGKQEAAAPELTPANAALSDDPVQSKSDRQAVDGPDERLSKLEQRLRDRPLTYAPASEYRARCASAGEHDRAIRFLQRLLARHPDDMRLRIELASAYVDKIPTCRGVTQSLCRGSLARKSLGRLDEVIAQDRDSWVALYCRGMNHLHWPRVLRHADDAVTDFKRCIRLQGRDPADNSKPHYVRTHIGLGDAHVKAKEYDQAIAAWQEGLERFPYSAELEERLAIKGHRAMLDFVERKRGLDRPVDTGLAFLDP